MIIILMLLPHRNLHDRSPCLNLKTQQDFQGPISTPACGSPEGNTGHRQLGRLRIAPGFRV